ncbi:2-dehydropantoate 2-reductase [Priestia aryabhattai]|uniref:2-dehydropantoate 2-reductase n=1 Tax=Priestia aryabhattai TaxID=412384 RepID=UPI001873F7D1|nr:2-dehydropantoate 2-reductase [Priestia aryabhattai]MBE5100939.1 2-dehydropantoate 2-reductase [Priestia aryabhattai]
MKTIGIIGGGSLGLLFSAYLSDCYDVTLYTKTKTQAKCINENGIALHRQGEHHTKKVSAIPLEKNIQEADLIIITVKQYHLKEIIPFIKNLTIHTPLLFIQNGMSHIEILKNLPQRTLYLGTVEHGAMRANMDSVHHTGIGTTRIASYRGEMESILPIANFPWVIETDWYAMLVKKLVVNALINPLTALYRVKNGQLIHNSYFYKTMRLLFEEIAAVLKLDSAFNYWENALGVCSRTSTNQSSMLKDIQEGRQTEIDAILGYIQTQAAEKRTSTPIVDFLYGSIKGIEEEKGD